MKSHSLAKDDPAVSAQAKQLAEIKQQHRERPLMTVVEYAVLEKRYAALQSEFAATGQLNVAALRELMDAGFDIPKPGIYVVAVFPTLPRNQFQEAARKVYYRAPSHFHCLLPWLGEVAPPRHPGHASPGLWHRPNLRP